MVVGGWNNFSGLTRGELAGATKQQMLHLGLYRGEKGCEEEVVFSKTYGDIVTMRNSCEVKRETLYHNLRQPFLLVCRSDDSIVSVSTNINCSAVDNKVTAELSGRTGAFCTACRAPANAMLNVTPETTFFMNMDILEVQNNFDALYKTAFGDCERGEIDLSSVTLPSSKADYSTRFGQKHAPLTTEWDSTKALSVLHASLLTLCNWVMNLQCRVAAGVLQWGKGKRFSEVWSVSEIIFLLL